MKLKSITISGFKSFREKTEIEFDPGINCIIGPNGSGKSNIVDAFSWVMGEQGSVSLRGGKMTDVIFSGSEKVGPLGRAEVSVLFDNSSGVLNSDFSEIKISRTLFRDGSSDYAINGESCRLLDVQELLSDAGLGREMHTLVNQGQIDQVLRSQPAERRAFIEEASGVLKYRRRKERSERKLDAMNVNLTRLNDLLTELARTRKALGRQAKIAEQANEIGERIRRLKTLSYQNQVKQLTQELELLSTEDHSRRAESAVYAQTLEANRETVRELELNLNTAQLESLRGQLFHLETLLAKAQSLGDRAGVISSQELGNYDQNFESIDRISAEGDGQKQVISQLDADISEAEAQLSQLVAERLRADAAVQAKNSEVMERSNSINQAKALRDSRRAEIDRAEQSLGSLRVTREEKELEISSLSAEVEALRSELISLEATTKASDSSLRNKFDAAKERESKLRDDQERARQSLAQIEMELAQLVSRRATLNLLSEEEDLVKSLDGAKLAGISGYLAEQLKIDPGYEAAVAAALGTLANALIASSLDSAISALKEVHLLGAGRVEFLVSSGKLERGSSPAPDGSKSASSAVVGPPSVIAHLDNFLIVDDLDAARSLLEIAAKGEKTLVTLAGELITGNSVRGGKAKKTTKVEIKAELEQIAEMLAESSKSLEQATGSVEEIKVKLSQATAEVESSFAELKSHDESLAQNAERIGSLRAKVDLVDAQILRTRDEIAEANQLEQESVQQIAELRSAADLTEVEEDLNAEQELAPLLQDLERAREAEMTQRVAISSLNERRESARRRLGELDQQLASMRAAEESQRVAREQRQALISKALVAHSVISRVVPLLQDGKQKTQEKLRSAEEAREGQLMRLSNLRADISKLEDQVRSLEEGNRTVEMRTYELKVQLKATQDRYEGELSMTPEEVLALEIANEENLTQDALASQLASQERLLRQLGAFNPLALEEYQALEERFNYLSQQLEDLNDARAELRTIIRELDAKMQESFASAFEDTKREFEKVFPQLFPGGQGTLALTESEDGSEVGVEVNVRPAGKKIARMSLLSGGERSLAAVALLVAIFRARPSPFYVLDEVEAALDETNLERLLGVIGDLGESAQLIVVTHQKKTMEIANALYGVSMAANGFTKVIAQSLEKAS